MRIKESEVKLPPTDFESLVDGLTEQAGLQDPQDIYRWEVVMPWDAPDRDRDPTQGCAHERYNHRHFYYMAETGAAYIVFPEKDRDYWSRKGTEDEAEAECGRDIERYDRWMEAADLHRCMAIDNVEHELCDKHDNVWYAWLWFSHEDD